jgi:hypothetical protein
MKPSKPPGAKKTPKAGGTFRFALVLGAATLVHDPA